MPSIEQSPIFQAAKKYYDPRLPYHNWDHVLQTYAASRKIIKNCQSENIEVDEVVVDLSIAFHDADYIKDHLILGFSTKEALSVSIAEKELPKYNFESYITKVKQGIMATDPTTPLITIEQKIIRASDLAGLAGNYKNFKKNNLLLKQEAEMRTGNKFTGDEWKMLTNNIIVNFLSQNIQLTKHYFDKNGNSTFQVNARRNLKTFFAEII